MDDQVFNMIKLRIKKLVYDLLPFKIFYRTLYCVHGSRNPRKCRFCTCFFVDDIDVSFYFDHKFRFKRSNFKDTQVEFLLDCIKRNTFLLSLYYVISDFSKDFYNVNENFGIIFFELANKPFMLYLIYLEVFLKVFFNMMKVISDYLIHMYFSNFKAIPHNFTNFKNR